MERAFSPHGLLRRIFWDVAPVWYGAAPLARGEILEATQRRIYSVEILVARHGLIVKD